MYLGSYLEGICLDNTNKWVRFCRQAIILIKMVTSRTSSQLPTYLLKKGNMISKIYGSNQILFKVGSRKGKTKAQLQIMVEKKR